MSYRKLLVNRNAVYARDSCIIENAMLKSMKKIK